jgi:hypothetical protein
MARAVFHLLSDVRTCAIAGQFLLQSTRPMDKLSLM